MIRRTRRFAILVPLAVCLCLAATRLSWGQVHPAVPGFSSRPDAAYTMYLNFGGFSFNGNWGNSPGSTPGVTPAYTVDGNANAFTASERANIKDVWSRVAEKYSPFNINVTTVDPAVAAGQAANDTMRQNFYDSQPRMMQTVIGGGGGWSGGGGVSYVGVTRNTQPGSNGYHTNWVFSAQAPSFLQFIGEASAHEQGHGMGLWHQSDYNGNTLLAEYSSGTGSGPGTTAPIMGVSYYSERGVWKNGTAHIGSGPQIQNDARLMATDPYLLGFIDDGIGHSLAAATPLPLTGIAINSATAKGVIVPENFLNPDPYGPNNYVSDYWSFVTGGGTVSLSLHSGRSTITPGVADPGAMLDATLRILDSLGAPVATSSASTLLETVTISLAPGFYYAQVQSAGDPGNLGFYDMGSYFLSGTIAPVPEPATLALLAMAMTALVLVSRRRRAAK
ncbi:MAG: PEP-CTERM sorting domain-containing protein [Pirellulales bacterium]